MALYRVSEEDKQRDGPTTITTTKRPTTALGSAAAGDNAVEFKTPSMTVAASKFEEKEETKKKKDKRQQQQQQPVTPVRFTECFH